MIRPTYDPSFENWRNTVTVVLIDGRKNNILFWNQKKYCSTAGYNSKNFALFSPKAKSQRFSEIFSNGAATKRDLWSESKYQKTLILSTIICMAFPREERGIKEFDGKEFLKGKQGIDQYENNFFLFFGKEIG